MSVMFLEDHYAMCADGHSCYCISLSIGMSLEACSLVHSPTACIRDAAQPPGEFHRIGLSGSVYVNQGKLFHQLQGRQGQRSLEGSTESRPGRAVRRGVQNICCEGKDWNRSWKLSMAKQPTHMKMFYFLTDKS